MNPRTAIHRIQNMTKSEYALAKHIPNATALKPLQPEDENENLPISPTQKFNIPRTKQQQQFSYTPKVEEEPKRSHQLRESQQMTQELLEELREYENQLRQARTIQINLEQELRQRADERAKLISEYELRISNLQNELAFLKTKKNADYQLVQLQEENERLLNENKSLKKIKSDLELQIDRLNKRYSENYDEQMRLMEAENINRNQQILLDKLKGKIENSDIDKVILMAEIDRLQELLAATKNSQISPDRLSNEFDYQYRQSKETVKSNRVTAESTQWTQEKYTLENQVQEWRQKHADSEFKRALFAIEIERLGGITAELQTENELLRQQVYEAEENSSAQITEFKRQYEFIIRPQIEAEIKNATGRLESDKGSLELQMQTYKTKITDLENRVSYLQNDLGKLQEKNLELSREVEDWKFKYGQLERGRESLKYSLEEEIKVKLEREKSDLSSRWNQDRAQYETDLARYKDRISELETKLIMVASENEHLNSVIRSKEEEIEALRKRLNEAIQEHKNQHDQLRQQLEVTFNQRLEIELAARIGQLDTVKEKLESELRSAQNQIAYYQDQITPLNNEISRLRQENVDKTRTIEQSNIQILLLQEKEREISSWKERYDQLQMNKNQEIEQLRIYYEDVFKSRLDQELKEAGKQVLNEKTMIEIQLTDIKNQYTIIENRLTQANSEKDKLQGLLNELATERDRLLLKVQDLQKEAETVQVNVEYHIRQTIEKEIIEIRTKFAQERMELDNYVESLKARFDNLQLSQVLLMAEIERLHFIIAEKEGEDDMWREKMTHVENQHMAQIQELKRQFEDILREKLFAEIQQVTAQLQDEKKAIEGELLFLQTKNKELQESFNYIADENSRLRSELNGKENELDQLQRKINQLLGEQESIAEKISLNIQAQFRSDFENQLKDLTGRFNNERTAFEDQIRQLKNRIAEIESKLQEAQEHNENLNVVAVDRHTEIEVMKNQFVEFEKSSRQKEIDAHERKEREKKEEVENSLRIASIQFQSEKSSLESQIQFLQQKNSEYQRDLNTLSTELERMSKLNLELKNEMDTLRVNSANAERRIQVEIDQVKIQLEMQYRSERDNLTREFNNRVNDNIQNYEAQIRELRQKINEYEMNMTLITSEVQRLSLVIKDKNSEIEILNEKIKTLGIVKEQELKELRQKLELEQRILLERELKGMADQFAIERAQNDARNKELRQKLIEYQNLVTYHSVEVERLTALYEDKLKEAELLKEQYKNLDQTRLTEIEEFRLTIESLKRNSLLSTEYEVRFAAERTSYEAQIMQHKHKIAELETVLDGLSKEVQRFKDLYSEKSRENETLKSKFGSQNYDSDEFEKLRRENGEFRRNLMESQERKVRLEVEVSNYQSQIAQLKEIIEAKKIEMAKLSELLESRKIEIESLYSELNKAKEQMSQKLKFSKEIESEYMLLETKQRNFDKEIGDLRNNRDAVLAQLEKNEVELAMKNKELLEKIQQIDLLKRKYEDAIQNVDSSNIINVITTTTRNSYIS